MYTQAMDTMGKDADEAMKVIRSAEEMRLQEQFDAHIDAGDFIEAKDWMPDNYRKRWCGRSASMRTPKSSACCPKATGSAAHPR